MVELAQPKAAVYVPAAMLGCVTEKETSVAVTMTKRTFAVLVLMSFAPPALAEETRTIEEVCLEAKAILDQQPRQVQDILATLCADHWDE